MPTVCVTGASGFIASWLVKLLLERGYTVRGTVRDPENLKNTTHLRNLPEADKRLELFKADLSDAGSFDSVVDCCDAVFHTASPVLFDTDNPQIDLINPALKGTINVLTACAKAKSVKRVVLTSSMAAVINNPARNPEDVVDDDCWSDPEYCRKANLWYALSKTLAEMEAWKLSKEYGLDLVTLLPGMVVGTLLQPTVNGSVEFIWKCLSGAATTIPNKVRRWVHVKDVAEAHILAYEVPTASGRYLCAQCALHYEEIRQILHELYPGYPVPTKCADEKALPTGLYKFTTEKLQSLGLKYLPIKEAIQECAQSLIDNDLLKGNV